MKYDNNKMNNSHIGSKASTQGHHLYKAKKRETSLNKSNFPCNNSHWKDQHGHRCNFSEKDSKKKKYYFHNKNTSGKR